MTRKMFLVSALLFCLPLLASGAEQKREPAPKSHSAAQPEKVGNYDEAKMSRDADVSSDCTPKFGMESKMKDKREQPEGDPQAPQNQVEYGGGG